MVGQKYTPATRRGFAEAVIGWDEMTDYLQEQCVQPRLRGGWNETMNNKRTVASPPSQPHRTLRTASVYTTPNRPTSKTMKQMYLDPSFHSLRH